MVDVIDSIADEISVDVDNGGAAVGIQVAQYTLLQLSVRKLCVCICVHMCAEAAGAADASDGDSRKSHQNWSCSARYGL